VGVEVALPDGEMSVGLVSEQVPTAVIVTGAEPKAQGVL